MPHRLKAFILDESGATAVEYGLVIGLVACVIAAVVAGIGAGLNAAFTGAANTIGSGS